MADQFNDALSVLNKLESEQVVFEATRTGLKYVKSVISAFQTAKSGLDNLEADKKRLEADIAPLQERYASESRGISDRLTQERNVAGVESEKISKTLEDLEARLISLNKELKDKEKFVADRSAQLDKEIKDKTEVLRQLNEDFVGFKKTHGL